MDDFTENFITGFFEGIGIGIFLILVIIVIVALLAGCTPDVGYQNYNIFEQIGVIQ